MSGLVLYIFTPPPGVPFRLNRNRMLRSPATLPTRITLQRAVTLLRSLRFHVLSALRGWWECERF